MGYVYLESCVTALYSNQFAWPCASSVMMMYSPYQDCLAHDRVHTENKK